MKANQQNSQIVREEFHSVDFFSKVKSRIAEQLKGKTFKEQKKILQQLRSGKTILLRK